MKRFFRFISIVISAVLLSGSVYAQAPDIYKGSGAVEKFEIYQDELSVSKTMTRKDAHIIIKAYIETKDTKNYTVSYTDADGKEVSIGSLRVQPFMSVEKRFFFPDIKNGIHNLTVNVSDKSRVAYSTVIRLNIMDEYEHQFMDKFSPYGVNVHLADSGETDYDIKEVERLEYAGVKSVRESISWQNIEKTKGVYNFGKNRPAATSPGPDGFDEVLNKHGIQHYRILGYANPNYVFFKEDDPNNIMGSWLSRNLAWWANIMMPSMPDGLMGWKNYVKECVDHYGPDKYEILNENWSASIYDKKTNNANVYTNVLKFATMGKIQTGPSGYNAGLEAYQTDQAQHWYITDSINQGVYPYVNAVASHAYTHPNDPDKNDSFRRIIRQTDENFSDIGGWKSVTLTEFGWSNKYEDKPPYPMVNAELASKYLVKNFIFNDDTNVEGAYMYAYNKYRLSEEAVAQKEAEGNNDAEYNFGLFDIHYDPKPTYVALTELNRRLNGAVYLGEVDLGYGDAQRAFLYLKDGKPVLCAWYYDGNGGTAEYNFNQQVTVYDRYGNRVYSGNGKFTVDDAPYYVYGLSDEVVDRCIRYNLSKMNKEYMSKYAPDLGKNLSERLNSDFNRARNIIDGEINADNVEKVIDIYDKIGYDILEAGKNESISQVVTSKSLYKLHRIIQKLINTYAAVYKGDVPMNLESDITAIEDKLTILYRNDNRIMQYSDEIYRYAKKYYDKAKAVLALEDNPQKAGIIKAYDKMAGILVDWTNKFTDFEDIIRYAIFAQVPYDDTITSSGTETKIDLSLFNYEKNDITTYAKIVDQNGKEVAKTGVVKIKADGYVTIPVSFVINKDEGVDSYNYKAEIYDENGNFIYDSVITFNVSDSMGISVRPIMQTPDEADSITFEINNYSKESRSLSLNIKSNNTISFGVSKVDVELKSSSDSGGVTLVTVPITSMKNTSYHFYSFEYDLRDKNGKVVYSGRQPVNFSCIAKAEKPINIKEFNENDWKDAYPIYLNPPVDVESASSWKNSNVAARVMYKWDENNLYVLADVYDNRFYNTLVRSDMWNGDCIQMTFDPENDKSTAYQADDIEVGFAKTTDGNSLYFWQTPIEYNETEQPEWLNIIRDDDKNLTRYMMAIPKEVLPGMELTTGFEYGYNIGINDADSLYRDNWAQLSKGTIDSKDPSKYNTFKLIDSESSELIPSIGDSIFSGHIEDIETVKTQFRDIEGHWAQKKIETLYELNVVNGKSDETFEPEGVLTRAEFCQMISKLLNKNTGSLYDIYSDVKSDEWYARSVQILYENSVIPEKMTPDMAFNPDKAITREEAAVIAANAYKVMKSEDADVRDISDFPDGNTVSEWAMDGVEKAIGYGLIQGNENKELLPLNTLTRAEGAAIVFNIALKTK